MMEKDMILAGNEHRALNLRATASNSLRQLAREMEKPLEWLGKYYGQVLGKPISRKQTWLMIEAQVAFALGVLPADCPLWARAICLAWLTWSVRKCKRAGV